MSTLKLENIKHENSSTNNMVMDSDGSTRTTGIHKVDSRLQVGNSSITQAYPQNNFGYVADFQGSAGTQTFISIAAPGVSLGNNGVIIGEDATDTYITQRGNKNIKLTTQDVTRVNIDGTGKVTMPYQPSFGAYQASANYTVANGYHKMVIDGTRWNEGNHYDTSNSKFVAPVSGVYHFSAHVNRYSVADDYYFTIQFYVNGSGHTMGSRLYSRGGADLVASMSHTIKLTANDYVEVYSYSNDTSSGFSAGATWNTFSGFLVG